MTSDTDCQQLMGTQSPAGRPRGAARAVAAFLFWAVVFGLAYTQAPLYYSNQNQYFLHGLARAGVGELRHDWLANTRDPTPLFSLLVEFTQRYLHPVCFYVDFFVLFGVYVVSLLGVARHVAALDTPGRRAAVFAALVLVHSALIRYFSTRWLGFDYPWYFQAGLAGQYVLGPMLQPSVNGVWLLLSVLLFLRDRPLAAACCAALAGVLHATYLLGGGVLVLLCLGVLAWEGRFREALTAGAAALLLVLPVIVYHLRTFAPSSPEAFAEAQGLLVHFRIPHHTLVARWLDGVAFLQVAWVVLAIYLVRGTRLFPVLLGSLLITVALTVVQVATRSESLALLFPWRTSVWLVPLATAVVLAQLVTAAADRLRGPHPALWAAYPLVLAACVLGGVVISSRGLNYRNDPEEAPLLEYVRQHHAAGDVYLAPVELPANPVGARGAVVGDFKGETARGRPTRLIPIGLQGFRLATGAPLYVDFKAIPYWDREVLEWRDRLLFAQKLYERLEDGRCDEAGAELRRRGITHVIMAAELAIDCDDLAAVYDDGYYVIYKVGR